MLTIQLEARHDIISPPVKYSSL